jgi:hypothetical protein
MRKLVALWAIVLAVLWYPQTRAGEPGEVAVQKSHFLARLRPAGGCNPDGRGLIHWWNPHCFPRACLPDDYCRKPIPNVCRSWFLSFSGPYPQPQPTAPAPAPPPSPSP